jgi:membrane-associated protease RseP (regulator of RpoE activity)
MRPSIETAVVDVAGTPGAVVVRAGGAGAKAGLAPGDTIVAAGGRPVASVADLRARIAAIATAPSDLALDVKNLSGVTRKVTVTVAMLADTIPMRDPSVLYNRALLDLSDAIASARERRRRDPRRG